MSRLRGHEVLKFHFSLINAEISAFARPMKGATPEDIWYKHLILGILVRVQNCHRDFEGHMELYFAYVGGSSIFTYTEVVEGYRRASRRILREGKKLRSK